MTRLTFSIMILIGGLLLAACNSTTAGNRAFPTFVIAPPTLTAMAQATDTPLPESTAIGLNPDDDGQRVLEYWVPDSGALSTAATDRWHFDGLAGDQIRVRALADDMRLRLTLQGPDGRALVAGESIETTLPENGTYIVVAQAVEGEGSYEIGLGYTDRPNPNDPAVTPIAEVVGVPTPVPAYTDLGAFIAALENNQTVGGQMDEDSPSHIYTFEGEAGRYVELEMRRVNGMIDPVLTLYDPDGVPLAIDDDSSGQQAAALRNVRLPVDGIYTVEAGGSNLAGGYSLRLLQYDQPADLPVTLEAIQTPTPLPTYIVPTPAPALAGNRLEAYVPVQAAVQPGGVNIHPLYAAEGEILTVGVTPVEGTGLAPQIEIVGPEGHIVAESQSTTAGAGGDALVSPLLATVEGTYQVFVSGENGTSGDYVIAYGRGSTRQEIMREEAEFDVPNEGSIDRLGIRDVWPVELRAGDVITVSANPGPTSLIDPIVEVVPAVDPEAILAIDDNGGGGTSALIRELRIEETGLYLFRVKAAQAASLGDYTLIWRYINVAPTSTPPPARSPLLSIQADVPDNEYLFFPFYGAEGQTIRVQVIGLDDFDPVAALIGPDGREIMMVDDVETDLNPSFTYTLLQDGTYNIRVNGYIHGGAFELYVEVLY